MLNKGRWGWVFAGVNTVNFVHVEAYQGALGLGVRGY